MNTVANAQTVTTSDRNHGIDEAGKSPLSLPRLNVLRVGYFVVGVGLVVFKGPLFLHPDTWGLYDGVVNCMLAAMSGLALLGLRYPLRMLPILLFESAWKLIWLSVVALPLWTSGQLDPATWKLVSTCLWVVIVLAVIPWRYVVSEYVTKRGERWR